MSDSVEPSADIRQATLLVRQIYVGYVLAGFTEVEALELVKVHVKEASA
jgi:hypothetical protein